MRMFMTEGMFGRCLEQIGPEFKTLQEALAELNSWKQVKCNKQFYKIEKYDRLVFDKDRNETAIDFGDYRIFMLVTGSGYEDFDKSKSNDKIQGDEA